MSVDTASHLAPAAPSKGLHLGLWVAQGLAAFAFLGAGATKLSTPIAELATKMPWVTHFPELAVRAIGAAELAGALGLVLPSALRIQPRLTPLAAAGLVLVMLGAAGTHVVLGEAPMMAPSVILGGLAAFVAWGRGVKAPIAPKD